MAAARSLVVFDFDRSLLEDDTDRWAGRLGGDAVQAIMESYKRTSDLSWTDTMGAAFAAIHGQGVTREQFESHMQQMVLHEDMVAACRLLESRNDVDCHILSDSNSVFIDTILEHYGLRKLFKRVVTNPARFVEDGCLKIEHCHSHSCALCPANLCKGRYLDEFTSSRAYDRVVYVGDGGGDYCPSLRLSSSDTVLARRGYRLLAKVSQSTELNATVVPWSNGTDILRFFKKHFPDDS